MKIGKTLSVFVLAAMLLGGTVGCSQGAAAE